MPTDPVLTLIADLRALCDDQMHQGRYEVKRVDVYTPKMPDIALIVNAQGNPLARIGIEEYFQTYRMGRPQWDAARYFAALDPALVRALLDVAEALYVDWNTSADDHEGEMAAAENLSIQAGAGLDALEKLAADRVAS